MILVKPLPNANKANSNGTASNQPTGTPYAQPYIGSLALDRVVNGSERYATPASTKTDTGVRSPYEPDRSAQLYNTVYPNMTTSYDISGTTGRTRAEDVSASVAAGNIHVEPKEIAQITAVSVGTVKSRINRARNTLKNILEDENCLNAHFPL